MKRIGNRLPTVHDPYAWYLRVPDLMAFLNHIKPVLEKRLANSIAAGHSCKLYISFYRTGLEIVMERGMITAIEPWKPSPSKEGNAGFPASYFFTTTFGYRKFL